MYDQNGFAIGPSRPTQPIDHARCCLRELPVRIFAISERCLPYGASATGPYVHHRPYLSLQDPVLLVETKGSPQQSYCRLRTLWIALAVFQAPPYLALSDDG